MNTPEAVAFLTFVVGWHGGVMPVYLDGADNAETWIDLGEHVADAGADLAKKASRWDLVSSSQVEIGLPEQERLAGIGVVSCLWCWAESKDSAFRAAKRFPAPPTIVLRMGSSARRLLLWSLREPVTHAEARDANERIRYALKAPGKWSDPDTLRIPLPGTFLRRGRTRPVLVTRMDAERTYTRGGVVGELRDPPAADAWRERVA